MGHTCGEPNEHGAYVRGAKRNRHDRRPRVVYRARYGDLTADVVWSTVFIHDDHVHPYGSVTKGGGGTLLVPHKVRPPSRSIPPQWGAI